MKKSISFLILVGISGIAILTDIVTKILAVNYLKGKQDIEIWKGILCFSYLENTGSAFSLFEGYRWFLVAITSVLILGALILYSKISLEKEYAYERLCIIFFVAGGIGNLLDRIRFGYVIDFIYYEQINFPKFNLADCYITLSMLGLIVITLLKKEERTIVPSA